MAPSSTASLSRAAAADDDYRCVLGGDIGHISDYNFAHGIPYTAIAGPNPDDDDDDDDDAKNNSTSFVAECCTASHSPHSGISSSVHFVAPCLLWCEFDSYALTASWTSCLAGHGVDIRSVDGQNGGYEPYWKRQAVANSGWYGIVAIAAGMGLAFAIVQRVRRNDSKAWWKAMKLGPAEAGQGVSEEDGRL
ncbi:hypothetical protein Micbo1qcDRAFT_156754 [Microdochium bolleyi]|uniref:Uncharacterized protein n=1 Tax=Microdochium bolleyi TaxID=196109 RepID=A0A136JCT0_9PEZI|nr:hypothetical protein Micbo1qcDRAFT_156754 [Microdochium bolleyi]